MTELVRLTEMDAAWAVRGAGARLDAVRRAGRKLRERILAGGAARCVRTADLATFPYPTRYGLQGVARSPAPTLAMKWPRFVVPMIVPPSAMIPSVLLGSSTT